MLKEFNYFLKDFWHILKKSKSIINYTHQTLKYVLIEKYRRPSLFTCLVFADIKTANNEGNCHFEPIIAYLGLK